jgi:hypothetical protein
VVCEYVDAAKKANAQASDKEAAVNKEAAAHKGIQRI